MIKFFRKIRYDLMKQNKMSKYFKYAIGEIILVVIGILIALQINNWNEDRKNDLKLTKTLVALYNDLAEDSIAIVKDLEWSQNEVINDSLIWLKLNSPTTNYDTCL